MGNVSVLLVDDEIGLLKMLSAVLIKEGITQISHATNGRAALQKVQEGEANIILLDVELPDMEGFEVCRQIRQYSNAPIIFLTARDTDLDKLMGFGIGGDDYITKPFNPLEVVARIKAIAKRLPSMTIMNEFRTEVFDYGYFKVDKTAGELQVAGETVECPAKEWDLLVFFCSHPNRIYSARQLYESIWNFPYLGDDKTVVIHISRLRKKIEPDPQKPRYLVNIRGLGYKIVSGGDKKR